MLMTYMGEHKRATTMIRKQFSIAPEQQQKLRALAKRWQCTEAEVVRRALAQLSEPEPEDEFVERLREAGLLVEPENDPTLPPPSKAATIEKELHERLRRRATRLDLTAAVIEDRR